MLKSCQHKQAVLERINLSTQRAQAKNLACQISSKFVLSGMRKQFVIFIVIAIISTALIDQFLYSGFGKLLFIILPIAIIGVYDMIQKKSSIRRNFPILGRGRKIMEELRPKIQQYFIESDINGRPFSRIARSLVYARSEKGLDTNPFGTQLNNYEEGYEWMHHSIGALDHHKIDSDPRVKIGGSACKQPYHCSLYNVSAMSFGSLSSRAILSLNGGAKIGGFAHNTGEGGISPYHLEHGGDLIYQIGTGYFGCRNKEGDFDEALFVEQAKRPSVKMIELKLSQGAKPGHGGILPAKKNTPEIAKIRNIDPGTDVLSPPFHTAFSGPTGLLEFIQRLRTLSNGKPIGFKLCVGAKHEFLAICKAMQITGIKPDFISVDGGEGGTGAAPVEFSDSVGMPFREGMAFVYNALEGFGLKEEIKLIASGKIVTGFDMFRAFALGADVCYSARAMMLAIGCIQALECNQNSCPTGVATHRKDLVVGLDVNDKTVKVANFQKETVESFIELMAAAGIYSTSEIDRSMVYRRLNMHESMPYTFIYPYIPAGCLMEEDKSPSDWRIFMEMADPKSFQPRMRIKV